jgi:hypothetical protein
MARRSVNEPETKSTEPLARAVAVIRAKGGGWITRTYLVPQDSTLHESHDPDTLGAAMGRSRRILASEAK